MLRPSLPPSSSLYLGSLFESIVSLAGGGGGEGKGLDLAMVRSVVKLVDDETAKFRELFLEGGGEGGGKEEGGLFEVGCRGLCYLSFLSRFICLEGKKEGKEKGEGEKGKEKEEGRGGVHVGSKCRGCSVTPIVGIRYRCVSRVCIDFFVFISLFIFSFPDFLYFFFIFSFFFFFF